MTALHLDCQCGRTIEAPELDALSDAFLAHVWYNKSYWQAISACWRTRTPVMVRGDSCG